MTAETKAQTALPKVDATLAQAPLACAYERIYREAGDDPARLPWHLGGPDPLLLDWLNTTAPGILRPGARCVVVGCGLADDAAELVRRGYDAMGFDASEAAVEWAQRRHPHLASGLRVACCTSVPTGLLRRFDLVVECRTMQSVEPALRHRAMRGIASLARPHGRVVVITSERPEGTPLPAQAPWPLTEGEVLALTEDAGLAPDGEPVRREDPVGKAPSALRQLFRPGAQSTR